MIHYFGKGFQPTSNSYVPSCQQHQIIMRYSCYCCQRIYFVKLTQAPVASPGLGGPIPRAKDPIEKVDAPLKRPGVEHTAWSPLTTVKQPLEMTGQSAVT